MEPESLIKAKQLLINHEGYEKYPYVDTKGKLTIGIGYNISDRGMPDAWINQQCEEDINVHYNNLMNDFPWYKELNEARQIALVDMCFMGYKKFKEFHKMLAAFEVHDYNEAAYQMLNSDWAFQVKKRAVDLSNIIQTGELNGF